MNLEEFRHITDDLPGDTDLIAFLPLCHDDDGFYWRDAFYLKGCDYHNFGVLSLDLLEWFSRYDAMSCECCTYEFEKQDAPCVHCRRAYDDRYKGVEGND